MKANTTQSTWQLGGHAEFSALARPWQELAARHRYASLFLDHGWLDAAWQWRQADADLLSLSLDGADGLRSAAVFQSRRRRIHRIPVRCLELLSIPDSQEVDLLCDRQHEHEVAMALVQLLSGELRDWDVLDLKPLRPDAWASTVLPAALHAAGLPWRIESAGANATIPLAGAWEDYYATRSRRLKKGNNLIANRLRRKFRHIELQRLPVHAAPEREEARRILTEISRHSWKAERTHTTLDQPAPGRFLERLLERYAARDRLQIWTLRLDERPVAAELQLDDGEVVSALRSDFRQELGEDSPGSYLNWKLLEQLFATRDGLYRMGPGANAYKARWQVAELPLQRLLVYNHTVAGTAARIAGGRLAPLAARWKRRFTVG